MSSNFIPNMKYADDDTLAYNKGFRDGLEIGVNRNKYKRDNERHLYNNGYDAGVAEYCRKAHPEDEDV